MAQAVALILILVLILVFVKYVKTRDYNPYNLDKNIINAIETYDTQIKIKNNELYFGKEKIRTLYDPYYSNDKINGYFYCDLDGKNNIKVFEDNKIIRIQERNNTSNVSSSKTTLMKHKKNPNGPTLYDINNLPSIIKKFQKELIIDDGLLHIKEYNGLVFGYCKNENGFGYSSEFYGPLNSLSLFENSEPSSKEKYILFSLPLNDYTYVEYEKNINITIKNLTIQKP